MNRAWVFPSVSGRCPPAKTLDGVSGAMNCGRRTACRGPVVHMIPHPSPGIFCETVVFDGFRTVEHVGAQ